jgi:hypothetical protein
MRLMELITGRDLELMDIARDCLVKAGRPTCVLAGAKLFPQGQRIMAPGE